jgi:5,6-dimethylbenzimidazole synthase
MQPWRFIRISDRLLRGRSSNWWRRRVRTAEALGERSDAFMKLKVEGINDCAEVLVAALMDDRERHIRPSHLAGNGHGLAVLRHPEPVAGGPREGLGMGWVSLFEPQALADLLGCRPAKPVAVLCLGPVSEFYPAPMLAARRLGQPRPLSECCMKIIGE